MKKCFALLLFISLTLISCEKDNDDLARNPAGVYTETFPVSGRTHITFLNDNTLFISESGSDRHDEFTYVLTEDKIVLTLSGNSPVSTEHEFEIVSASKIRIGNFHPSFPESPPVIMVFEKQ